MLPESLLPIPAGHMGGGAQQPQQTTEQREPIEKRNNLISRSFARILDMVSEGPIAGLCTRSGAVITNSKWFGMGVYLNGTAMISPSGKPAFSGVSIGQTYGTQNQPMISGFSTAEETFSIGLPLKHGQPQNIEIVDATTTSVLVAIKVASLFKQDKKSGDINGTGVEVRVDIILRGGAIALTRNIVIVGKTQSDFVKNVEYVLPRSGDPDTDFWTVRVTRVTNDADTVLLQNPTEFFYLTRVVGAQLRYPNSAVMAVQFDAQSFSSIPTRAYNVKGRLIKVPSNYYPPTRGYNRDPITGHVGGAERVWDGTFWTTWSDNPAWCFYDICINTRYGLGDFLQAGQVDKWTLYQVARYCDEKVPNPVNSRMEPRYTCNLYLQDRAEAIKVLTDMASLFRGFVYFASGTIVTVADMPKVPLMTFTNGNVAGGVFIYSSTAKRSRHTVVLVRWNDPADFYNPKFEYVSDDDGIAQFGIREVEVTGVGCTRRGQAIRMGKWALASELSETELVRFTTGLEGLYPRPGDIVQVLDEHRAGARMGGRLIGIGDDRKSVAIDKAIVLEAGQNTLSCVKAQGFIPPGTDLPDSSFIGGIRSSQLVTRVLTNVAGLTAELTFADALPEGVVRGSVWAVESANLKPQLFRVLQVTEAEGNKFEIQGMEHNPGKYAAVEQALTLTDEQITKLPDFTKVADPLEFKGQPGYNDTPELVGLYILLSWKAPMDSNIRGYILEAQRGDGNWVFVSEVTATSYQYSYTDKGTYGFRLFTVNTVGVRSTGVMATVVIDAAVSPVPPPAVTGLELVGADGQGQGNDPSFVGRDATFQWRVNSPLRSYDFGEEPMGAAGAVDDPYFLDFEISVYAVGSTTRRWYETTKTPHFVFTFEKNAEAFGTPSNVFKVVVNARDKYNTAGTAATLTASNPAPAQHQQLTVLTSFKAAFLTWVLPLDRDVAYTEVWMAEGIGRTFADAALLSSVSAPGTTFSYLSLITGQVYRFWVRAVDTFGSHSNAFPDIGNAVVPGSLAASDLDNLAVDLTGTFAGTIALKGAKWNDNDPVPGAISWNAHQVAFDGRLFAISGGNTNLPYVWWRGPVYNNATEPPTLITDGEDHYRASATHPKDAPGAVATNPNDFIVATNADSLGVHDEAWHGFANALIGSAWIRDAAIKDAHIANVSADKLTAGTIDAQLLTVAGVAGGLQSENYVAGVSGWKLRGDGFAEIGTLLIRDNLAFSAGYYNPDFPTRIFQPRPDIVTPITTYGSGWKAAPTTGSPNLQTLICKDGATRVRQMVMFYGQLQTAPFNTDKSCPSPLISPLFLGVDMDDWTFNLGEADELVYLARPRRLGRDGVNTFSVEAWARCWQIFSVWYQVYEFPVFASGGGTLMRESMGNRTGTNAAPTNAGLPWKFAFEVLDSTATAGYQYLAGAARVQVNVPKDKAVLFAIAPINGNGVRDATAGSANMYNGFMRVTAENAGNILITEDPGAVDGDDV
jgi:predicted phage tail protein